MPEPDSPDPMKNAVTDRFARTNPFLDELDAIGYQAIPKTELAALTAEVERLHEALRTAGSHLIEDRSPVAYKVITDALRERSEHA